MWIARAGGAKLGRIGCGDETGCRLPAVRDSEYVSPSLTINCKLHCSKLIHPSRWKKCGSLIEIEGEIESAYTEFKQRHQGLSRVPSMLVR